MGIEDDHGHRQATDRALDAFRGLGAIDPGRDVLRQAVHRPHGHLLGPDRARDQERLDRPGGAIGAGAAQGIVELSEEDALPGLGQLGTHVRCVAGEQAAHLVEDLGLDQRVLGLRVRKLQVGPGRVAPNGVPLELAGHRRAARSSRPPRRRVP